MTTNLQDTGNLRSIAHKLLKKILKPLLCTLFSRMWAGCKVGKLQSRERMENQTNRFCDIVQPAAAIWKKMLFKRPLPMKTFVFTPASSTESLTFSHYFLPLYFYLLAEMFRFWVSRNTFPSNAFLPHSDRAGCGRSGCEENPAWELHSPGRDQQCPSLQGTGQAAPLGH